MERRGYERIVLDLPYFVELQFAGRQPVSAMLTDVSCGGLQASLPPQFENPSELMGKEAIVLHLPFGGVRPLAASVAWVHESRCGVQFAQPLQENAVDLAAFSRSL